MPVRVDASSLTRLHDMGALTQQEQRGDRQQEQETFQVGKLRLAGIFQVEPTTFKIQESFLNLEALVVFGEGLQRARFVAHDEPGFLSSEGMDGRNVDGPIAPCREVHIVHHHQMTMLAQ